VSTHMPSFSGSHTRTSSWQLVLLVLYIAAVAGLPTIYARRYCPQTVEIHLRLYCFMQHNHYTHMQHDTIPRQDAECVSQLHIDGQHMSPTYHHRDAVADSHARCNNTTPPVTPLHSYYYKKTITVEQHSTELWATTIPEREQFYSRPRTYPVQCRRMARHNLHLAIDGVTQNTTPHSQHHRSMSIKPRGYMVLRFILKNSRRNQRTSKHIKNSTPVQFRT
jgi:hypothetical protein